MPSTSPESAQLDRGITVLYDGDCPLCSREIAWYRGQTASESIRWVDLARCEQSELPPGIRREVALRRFHVLEADGHAVTGAAAFLRLWAAYPRLARHVRLARLPGVLPLLERGYRLFLRLRPTLARNLPVHCPREGDPP